MTSINSPSNLSAHELKIWNHLKKSYPENMNEFPQYYSSLKRYLDTIDFNESFDLEKLEIPIHTYLKDATTPHPLVEEIETIIEEYNIILKPMNDYDLEGFVALDLFSFPKNKTAKWIYVVCQDQNYDVDICLCALEFQYKGFSFAAISLHPGGNLDYRGPYMQAKIYMLKYGKIKSRSAIKGFIHGTNITLDKHYVSSEFFYNESIQRWLHRKTNIPVELKISDLPSNLALNDPLPEIFIE